MVVPDVSEFKYMLLSGLELILTVFKISVS